MGKTFSHLTFTDRLKLESLRNCGVPVAMIARELQKHPSTIYRELKRATYEHLNSDYTTEIRYSPDIAEEKYQRVLKAKGRDLKIRSDEALLLYLESKILKKKMSPYAALQSIQRENKVFAVTLSRWTVYKYIRIGIFPHISMEDLPQPRHKKKHKKVVRKQARANKGTSIEKRPAAAENREELGHWEGDTVVGKTESGKCVLVFTERISLKEVIEPLKTKSANEVVRAMDRIERRMGEKAFRETFKSITVDNGSEFADVASMERSRRNKRKRTKIYYCHAYRATERARNESQNKFIRRFLPRGESMNHVTMTVAKDIEDYMNNYPRAAFNGATAAEVYERWRR